MPMLLCTLHSALCTITWHSDTTFLLYGVENIITITLALFNSICKALAITRENYPQLGQQTRCSWGPTCLITLIWYLSRTSAYYVNGSLQVHWPTPEYMA